MPESCGESAWGRPIGWIDRWIEWICGRMVFPGHKCVGHSLFNHLSIKTSKDFPNNQGTESMVEKTREEKVLKVF